MDTQTNETGAVVLSTALGQDFPVRFGLAAIRRLCKHFQCNLKDLPTKVNEAIAGDQIELMLLLVKTGGESDAALTNRPFDYNEDQLLSVLDKPGTFEKLMQAFNGSFSAFSDGGDAESSSTGKESGNAKASDSKAGKTSGGK